MTLYENAGHILESVARPEVAVEREELSSFLSAQRAAHQGDSQPEPGDCFERVAALWATLVLGLPGKAKEMADALDFTESIDACDAATTVEKARALLAVAAVHLAGADLPQAMRAARLALHYSAEKEARLEEVAAHGLLAAILALCGHYEVAKGHLAAAEEIEKQSGASSSGEDTDQELRARWPRLFGELLIEARQGGLPFAAKLAEVPLEPSTNDIVGGYRVYRDAVGRIIRGDFLGAQSQCEAWRSRPDCEGGAPLFNHLLLGTEVLCLLQAERPGKVLSLLDGAESPPGWFVHYESLIANAYILLGSPQKALEVSSGEPSGETPQCVSAKASRLLREAVALEMLEDHEAADFAFYRASQLADIEGGAVPPIGLPLPVLEALASRLAVSHPEIGENLAADSYSQFEVRDAQSPLENYAQLTPRELELAEQLAAGKTFPEIAKLTFRSLNTLKAQSRSLYKKLGVESRGQAISVLRRAGFFT